MQGCSIISNKQTSGYLIPYPYDPTTAQTVPLAPIFDWDHDPPAPPPAYVVAAPGEFEVSIDPKVLQNFAIASMEGGRWKIKRPSEVVRLKESVAKRGG